MGQPSVARVDEYDYGDLVRSAATFVSTDLVTPADPSTIIFLTLNELGSVASYQYGAAGASITRVPTGGYYKDWTPDATGDWWYRWVGTGGVQAADEWQIVVGRSKFIF